MKENETNEKTETIEPNAQENNEDSTQNNVTYETLIPNNFYETCLDSISFGSFALALIVGLVIVNTFVRGLKNG